MISHNPKISPQSGGVSEYASSRPRVLGWLRSAALLDGDWGTSIAYVLGISFALAGYSSFWHLSWMLGLTALVAVNYITICRLYPNGGGVYSSVYHRSKIIAVIGALLLAADYVITMALSVLDACHYLNLPHPQWWAIAILVIIGALNWYGPKNSGTLAVVISTVTTMTLITIILASAPTALTSEHVQPPTGRFFENWRIFVGIILSISGIEAISTMTGLMKNPQRDSRRAILAVLAKVVVATIFLGLAMHAVPQLQGNTEDMARYLGEHYVGSWFGWVVALALGLLLISAGNTAFNGLINIQFLMAIDHELPSSLRRLNRHGVPVLPLLIAVLAPIVILMLTHDIMILAQLYAIGVVGAIFINIGSTSTDFSLSLRRSIRFLMIISAVILFFIELSIAIEKPKATLFAGIVLVTGLAARVVAQRKVAERPSAELPPGVFFPERRVSEVEPRAKYLVALRGKSENLLRFTIEEAMTREAKLFILRVQEIAVGTLPQTFHTVNADNETWIDEMCSEAGINYQILTIASNDVAYTIAEEAALLGVDRVILGSSRRSLMEAALKGDLIRSVSKLLPDEIQLVIFDAGAGKLSRISPLQKITYEKN